MMENYFSNPYEWLNRAQRIAGIGIWNQDTVEDNLWWSDQTFRIFGMEPQSQKMSFDKFLKMVHPDYRDMIIKKTDHLLKTHENPYEAEYKIVTKNNETKFLYEEALVEFDTKNKPIRIVGIIKDITEQRTNEAKLIEAKEKAEESELIIKEQNEEYQGINEELSSINEELQTANIIIQESNNTKDKFFSIIAHDLINPFNTMLGFSELLIRKGDNYNKSKQKEMLGVLNLEIQNTYKLLENLLVWSRSQQGGIDFNPERINLFLLSNEIIELLNHTANNKSIKLVNQIAEDLYLEADIDMLSTVLRNLISNALKFTEKSGKITVGASLVTTKNSQRSITISVKDTGVGISKERQSKLFNISENTSTNGTDNETGTGLGLVLCKEFVIKHGGKIWIESKVGKGSSFCFTIPVNSKNKQ